MGEGLRFRWPGPRADIKEVSSGWKAYSRVQNGVRVGEAKELEQEACKSYNGVGAAHRALVVCLSLSVNGTGR